jgi:hypothetical protein
MGQELYSKHVDGTMIETICEDPKVYEMQVRRFNKIQDVVQHW